jgi:hypothetical protein
VISRPSIDPNAIIARVVARINQQGMTLSLLHADHAAATQCFRVVAKVLYEAYGYPSTLPIMDATVDRRCV